MESHGTSTTSLSPAGSIFSFAAALGGSHLKDVRASPFYLRTVAPLALGNVLAPPIPSWSSMLLMHSHDEIKVAAETGATVPPRSSSHQVAILGTIATKGTGKWQPIPWSLGTDGLRGCIRCETLNALVYDSLHSSLSGADVETISKISFLQSDRCGLNNSSSDNSSGISSTVNSISEGSGSGNGSVDQDDSGSGVIPLADIFGAAPHAMILPLTLWRETLYFSPSSGLLFINDVGVISRRADEQVTEFISEVTYEFPESLKLSHCLPWEHDSWWEMMTCAAARLFALPSQAVLIERPYARRLRKRLSRALSTSTDFFDYVHELRATTPLETRVFAGVLSGMLELAVLHPLSVVAVRLQVQGGSDHVKVYTGTLDTVRKIVAKEGTLGLYRGFIPPLLGLLPEKAMKFFLFEQLQRVLRGDIPKDQPLPYIRLLISGLLSGTLTGIVICPFDVLRLRIQTMSGSQNIIRTVRSMYKLEGISTFWRGYKPLLLKESLSGSLYFSSYVALKRVLDTESTSDSAIRALKQVTAGAIAGVSASFISAPASLVQTLIVSQPKYHKIPSWKVAASLVRADGIASLFVGLAPRLMRSAGAAAMTFLFYEEILLWSTYYKTWTGLRGMDPVERVLEMSQVLGGRSP